MTLTPLPMCRGRRSVRRRSSNQRLFLSPSLRRRGIPGIFGPFRALPKKPPLVRFISLQRSPAATRLSAGCRPANHPASTFSRCATPTLIAHPRVPAVFLFHRRSSRSSATTASAIGSPSADHSSADSFTVPMFRIHAGLVAAWPGAFNARRRSWDSFSSHRNIAPPLGGPLADHGGVLRCTRWSSSRYLVLPSPARQWRLSAPGFGDRCLRCFRGEY